MREERVRTGVPGLDDILAGGFQEGSSYLLVGGPGTGKTILSLQFMAASSKRGERCLYLTFGESESALRRLGAIFGWDLGQIRILDFGSELVAGRLSGEYTVFAPAEVEQAPLWERVHEAISSFQPERLVLDSATFLRYLSVDEYQYRLQIQALVDRLSELPCVSLLLFEPLMLEHDNALALAVDGVIKLHYDLSASRMAEIRTIEVAKLRGSPFMAGRHPFRITSQGIIAWPHHTEKLGMPSFEQRLITSGIPGLDRLLKGGISAGGCTLISGPAGVGKTTPALQYLVSGAAQGHKGAIYTFEEGPASMVARCEQLSIPLKKCLESGSIVTREFNPLERYPEEFLAMLREDVRERGINLVLLDSLRGYSLAMEPFGNLIAHMQNIINLIRSEQANLFIVNEQERVTGDVQVTEFGVSYVADNILLLRYAEYQGRVLRVVSCLKKRIGDYEPEICELRFAPNGLVVGERLLGLTGLLQGSPRGELLDKPPAAID